MEYPEQLEAERARQEEMQRDTERRRALGEWFAEHEPNALVAKNAVEAFGYYSDVRIVDMLGLNDEHIAHRGPKSLSTFPGIRPDTARTCSPESPESRTT
ncbi:MAG: hypothetical protein L0G70_07130 [Rubrobacter sp.]|nr:hypothetical protein [Rubrobacter sp.]